MKSHTEIKRTGFGEKKQKAGIKRRFEIRSKIGKPSKKFAKVVDTIKKL